MSNGHARMVVPVTAQLRSSLTETEAFIEKLSSLGLNDKTHYGRTVRQLESLSLALLGCSSAGSLLVPKTDGARIDLAPNGRLPQKLTECVDYLGNHAANLLRHHGGALSSYDATLTRSALDQLKALHNLALTSIRRMAEEDLQDIRDNGVSGLLRAADALAQYAHGAVPGDDPVTVKDAAGKVVVSVDPWSTVAGPDRSLKAGPLFTSPAEAAEANGAPISDLDEATGPGPF